LGIASLLLSLVVVYPAIRTSLLVVELDERQTVALQLVVIICWQIALASIVLWLARRRCVA